MGNFTGVFRDIHKLPQLEQLKLKDARAVWKWLKARIQKQLDNAAWQAIFKHGRFEGRLFRTTTETVETNVADDADFAV